MLQRNYCHRDRAIFTLKNATKIAKLMLRLKQTSFKANLMTDCHKLF